GQMAPVMGVSGKLEMLDASVLLPAGVVVGREWAGRIAGKEAFAPGDALDRLHSLAPICRGSGGLLHVIAWRPGRSPLAGAGVVAVDGSFRRFSFGLAAA